MSPSLVIVVRSIFSFVVLLIYTRMLGKQQVSQLNFFDYVTGITIGSIAATMSTDLTSLGWHHFIGLTVWMLLTLSLQVISWRNRWASRVIHGEPVVVIHNGKMLEDNMKKARYSYADLMLQLRVSGAFDLADVEFAVYEPNGQLSVLLKSQKRPVTASDLGVPTSYEGLAVELINDGRVIEKNLADLGRDFAWLQGELDKLGIKDIENVSYAELNTKGELFVDRLEDDLGDTVKDLSDHQGPQ